MRVTFAPRGIVQFDEVRLCYKNFSGEPGPYNRAGDRSFSIVIDDEDIAKELAANGWNVREKPGREEGDPPFRHLPVRVFFNEYGPNVYLTVRDNVRKLNEETVDMLDHIYIADASIDIRPNDWNINGRTGRTAYLQSAHIVQEITDRFADLYPYDDSDSEPF